MPEIKNQYGAEYPYSDRHGCAANQGQNGFCKTVPVWNLFFSSNSPNLSMRKKMKKGLIFSLTAEK